MRSNILKILILILITVPFLQSCKEDCGCDAGTYKTVSNVEAKYRYWGDIFIPSESSSFYLCNQEIIPDSIQSLADGVMDGISVIISGELHKGCKAKGHSYNPQAITLTNIILSDNQSE